ncbi:MAG: transcriptional regulator [Micrococcaceae bacterium]|nr:transcriptional regulator [Micrococcaceae bacterium]
MRTLDHPRREDIQLDTVLGAVADPIRRRIIGQLARDHRAQACSAFELPVTKSTSTHHFRVLREAGVIEQRYQGTSIVSVLRTEDLNARFPGLIGALINAEIINEQPLVSTPAATL